MDWLFKKKNRIIDLSKPLNGRNRKEENLGAEEIKFETNQEEDKVIDLTEVEEKKKNLAKRISGMIEKMDGLSTKIYHLEQRIEVLEKRTRVNNFDVDGRSEKERNEENLGDERMEEDRSGDRKRERRENNC